MYKQTDQDEKILIQIFKCSNNIKQFFLWVQILIFLVLFLFWDKWSELNKYDIWFTQVLIIDVTDDLCLNIDIN